MRVIVPKKKASVKIDESIRKSLLTYQQRYVVVRGWYSGSESPSENESEEEKEFHVIETTNSITADLWQVVKALKFLRIGDPNSCVVALSSLLDCDMRNVVNLQQFFEDENLEILVNLLEVEHDRCVIGTLQLFKKITFDPNILRQLVDLGVCLSLNKLLVHMNPEFNSLACDVITNLATCRLAARNIRKCNSIPNIVSLLKIKKEALLIDYDRLTYEEKIDLRVTQSAAHALWALCTFKKNKKAAAKSGVIPIMSSIILTGNRTVSVPMTGMLCKCSSEVLFQLAIESEGLVGILLEDLTANDGELKTLCAYALANAAGHQEMVSHMIRLNGGVDLIKTLLDETYFDRKFSAALLNLIWKSAQVIENVKRYMCLKTTYTIIKYIESTDLILRIPATGAAAELAKVPTSRNRLIKMNILQALFSNLGSTNTKLLCNTAKAIGELVKNDIAMKQLQDDDAVRLLWSLLKNPSEQVQSAVLRTLVPVVRRARDAGELVRNLDGSLQMLVKMLHNKSPSLLADVCKLISEVAKDAENLTVMTEHGVIGELSNLLNQEGEIIQKGMTELDNLSKLRDTTVEITSKYKSVREDVNGDKYGFRQALAQAVAACSTTFENKLQFGMAGAITFLVQFLRSDIPALCSNASAALWMLSRVELNCIHMHLCGAVPVLLSIMPDCGEVTQISVAACLYNIRHSVGEAETKVNVCLEKEKENENQPATK